jgi:hypothetical protein
MRTSYLTTLTVASFLVAGIVQAVAQGTGGASSGASNGSGSQGQTGVPTKNSNTFSRPLNGANTMPLRRPYNATTGVGTAPNGAPIGAPGSGPGAPQQPYDSGAKK